MAKDNNPPAPGGARELRQRASERIGQWVRKKYRLDSLLGVGGMAAVYASTHRNGSRMAIKMLHAEFAGDDGVRERFLREGYVANKVDHPGRVAIIDDDETENAEPFLVMELLEGRTLQQLWKKKKRKLPIVEAMSITERVLDTLIPFHEQKIVHRDLKPANIFITHKDEVKILDFGVAQLREAGEEALTRAGSALGTPSYMSPEQAMGKSDTLDGRSDIYAMGATLYAVLSGKRLYADKSDNEAFILAATQPAPSIARSAPDLPVDVITVVDKALQWDRRSRYPDAKSMRDACRDVMRAHGSAPSPATVQSPTGTQPNVPVPSPANSPAASSRREMVPTPLSSPTALSALSALTPMTSSSAISAPSLAGPGSNPSSFGQVSLAPDHTPAPMDRKSAIPASMSPQSTSKLKELFTLLERALPTMRQYGTNHPESIAKIGGLHRAIVTAMRAFPQGFLWTVDPFCFSVEGEAVWEPDPPADAIPYGLSAARVEELAWLPGLTEQELRQFCTILVNTLTSDSDDVDVAEQLWEARFEHLHMEVGDDAGDDDSERQERAFAETDDLEAMAREDLAEAAAMAHSTDAGGSAAVLSPALNLDQSTRLALGGQLSLDPGRWNDRYLDVQIAGFIDSVKRGDPSTVLSTLADGALKFIKKRQFQPLLRQHHQLLERLNTTNAPAEATLALLTAGIYSEEVMKSLLSAAHDTQLTDTARADAVNVLKYMSATLDVRAIHGCLKLTNRLPEGEARAVMMEYVKRAAKGQEEAVIAQLDKLRPAFAQEVLASIVDPKDPNSAPLLQPLLKSRLPALRCEAIALLVPSKEQLKRQLLKLVESKDASMRHAALNTMVMHQVRSAGPQLIRLVEHEQFVNRPKDDQEAILNTLWSLNSERGESVLITVIDQLHGLMADDVADRTRILAIDLLSERSTSEAALEALTNATRRRPWNTPELRAAAAKAIEHIQANLTNTPAEEESE